MEKSLRVSELLGCCSGSIGGILDVGKHDFKNNEVKFKTLGFNRAHPPTVHLKSAIADLWGDLKARGKV